MTVSLSKTAFAATGSQSVALSNFVTITNDGANPAYLIVNGLDRNEYTKTSTGKTGTLSGNGATLGFTAVSGDARGFGVVFTWNAASGSYTNATYGNLLNLTVTTSASPNELADISFYGAVSQTYVTAYGAYLKDASAMCQLSDTSGAPFSYIGTASFATQSVGAAAAAFQATPGSVCATAMQFIGDTWNLSGCWVLASTIDAEAGAALPVSSSFAQIPGQAAGEWKVAYNGPVSANANWQSLLRPGDEVALITAAGSGHITTVVSGTGTDAMLVDNIDYGTNLAGDGNANDLIIAPPHSVSQEFTGANPGTVVIYRLDTPTVTAASASQTVGENGSFAFTSLFSASDWAGTAITGYQAYETSAACSLIANGAATTSATSAASCVTVSSLSALGFLSSTSAGTDTVYLRALNAGGYWGDWSSVAFTIANGAATLPPPVLVAQTAAQSVYGGQSFSFSVANAFKDPSGAALTDSATLAGGAALPGWLTFNAQTNTFSGTAPAAPQTVSLLLTATNTGGASASETITLTTKAAPPPVLAAQTPTQAIYGGAAFSISVASAFKDPNGESLTDQATLSTGAALPSWLTFNAATATFSGTAPAAAQTVSVKLTATNAGGSSASETFAITVKTAPAPVLVAQTASQTLYAGQSLAISLAGVFKDPSGEALTEKATLPSGVALPSWLSFNTATGMLTGTAPATAQTVSVKLTATNAGGSSASETFTITDKLDVPSVGVVTPTQTVYEGRSFSFSTASVFKDPTGTPVTQKATLATGAALPNWLTFNATTDTFSGTAPITAATLSLKVTGSNAAGFSANETFTLFVKAPPTSAALPVHAVVASAIAEAQGMAAGFTSQIFGPADGRLALTGATPAELPRPDPAAGALLALLHPAGTVAAHDVFALRS